MRGLGRAFFIQAVLFALLGIANLPATSQAQTPALPTFSHPLLLARFPAEVRAAEAGGAAYPRRQRSRAFNSASLRRRLWGAAGYLRRLPRRPLRRLP